MVASISTLRHGTCDTGRRQCGSGPASCGGGDSGEIPWRLQRAAALTASTRAILRDVRDGLEERLAGDGFRRRAGFLYSVPVTPGVVGWLGLNRILGQPGLLLSINPVVGVRHNEVELLVSSLAGNRSDPKTTTFAEPLSYVMPEKQYREWSFRAVEDIPYVLDDLAAAIKDHGLPNMRRWANLSALLEVIQRDGEILEYQARRVPAALALLGRKSEAARSVSMYLERLAGRLSYPEYLKIRACVRPVSGSRTYRRDHPSRR